MNTTAKARILVLSGIIALMMAPSHARQDLKDLTVSPDRVPVWSAGVDGGIPDIPIQITVQPGEGRDGPEGDDAPAIQEAIDNVRAPGAVFLPEGTYRLAQPLRLKSGVVLRGAGPDKTRLRADFPTAESAIFILSGRGQRRGEPALHLQAGFEAGSRELTLEQPADLRRGQYVAILCDNDPDLLYTSETWDAPWAQNVVGQVLRIRDIQGPRLQLDRPLRLSYRRDLRPRLMPFDAIECAGIEDLHVVQDNDKPANIVRIHQAAECWVRNVHSEYCLRAHVWISHSRGIVVRDSLMHHAHDYGGGGHGYGVVAGRWTTDSLIENNTFDYLRHAMMTKEGANGNVFGYNASYRCVHNCDISVHGHYSYMNLFEGNVVQRVVYADWWGPTGPYTTAYRNRVENETLDSVVARPAIEIRDQSHDANILMNTLVRTGLRVTGDSQRAHVEKNLFLRADPAGTDALTPAAPPPAWNAPASLYLTGKPPWWNQSPWPAIGADTDLRAHRDTETLHPIPAETRYRAHQARRNEHP